MICKICRKDKPLDAFYAVRSRRGDKVYDGRRRECKPCTLNRNERERRAWKDDLYRVYILPAEHYCGYTNNLRHRMVQHRRTGKNVTGFHVVFESKDAILAHLIETEYHLDGYAGFGKNVGSPSLRKYTSRRETLEICEKK